MDKRKNLRRWRLILGGEGSDGTDFELEGEDIQKDLVLSALYDYEIRNEKFFYNPEGKKSTGGKEASAPYIARWLGDIRKYFPKPVVEIIQDDALSHPELKQKLILDPLILEKVEPSVHLVATLMELGKMIPPETKETARQVVQKVVKKLMEKLQNDLIQAINGAISRSVPNPRPKQNEIDWKKSILKNLKHYQHDYQSVIPEKLYGYGRKSRKSLKDIILCLDQSASMGSSIVYSGIFGSVMASIPAVTTKMVVFDTEVADLSEDLDDPIDILFGVQLGGGTNIDKALGYCQGLVSKPNDSILVLITDLEEGGSVRGMLAKMIDLKASGVQVIVLLALNDEGKPYYSKNNAQSVSKLGIPVFACHPDLFPDLMAAAIAKQDIKTWAGEKSIVVERG